MANSIQLHDVQRLDDTPEGGCTLCEEPAYMWVCRELDGYVDACEEHSLVALADAVRSQGIERRGGMPEDDFEALALEDYLRDAERERRRERAHHHVED